jgi:hypothetical protein
MREQALRRSSISLFPKDLLVQLALQVPRVQPGLRGLLEQTVVESMPSILQWNSLIQERMLAQLSLCHRSRP